MSTPHMLPGAHQPWFGLSAPNLAPRHLPVSIVCPCDSSHAAHWEGLPDWGEDGRGICSHPRAWDTQNIEFSDSAGKSASALGPHLPPAPLPCHPCFQALLCSLWEMACSIPSLAFMSLTKLFFLPQEISICRPKTYASRACFLLKSFPNGPDHLWTFENVLNSIWHFSRLCMCGTFPGEVESFMRAGALHISLTPSVNLARDERVTPGRRCQLDCFIRKDGPYFSCCHVVGIHWSGSRIKLSLPNTPWAKWILNV